METLFKKIKNKFLNKKLVILSIMLFLAAGKAGASVPTWSVDPMLYNYQMTFVGAVYINGAQIPGTNNIVGAFINNQCRGTAKPVFNTNTGYWTYYLTTYGSVNGETVNFRFYNSVKDTIYLFSQTSVFKADANSGSVFEPNAWSWPVLNSAIMSAFSLPGQRGSEIIGNTMNILMPVGSDVGALKATYTASAGAIVKIGDIVQQSTKSTNNFSSPLTYVVRSSEGSATNTYVTRIVNYNMSVVATVYADTVEAGSASDTLYAYIRGQLRGKAVSVLNSDIKSRRFTITIYNPTDTGVISFKFYSKVKEQTIDLSRRMTFVNNTIAGTQYNPVKFSAPELKGKTLFTYNIPGQIGQTYYYGNEIRVVAAKGTDTLFVTPEFKISAGAIVSISDSVQYSAITSAKFSAAKTYKISASELSSSQNYTVRMVSNSMNVVATVYADTIEAASASDTLYAFIHGQLRGKAVSVLNNDIKSRRFTITIYNPTDTGIISFKFYSKVKEQTLDLSRRMTFVNNTISGTQYNPVKFSLPELKGKTLFTYNIPGQIGQTYYYGNEIRVVAAKGTDTLFVTPEFKISAGAIASISDSVQYSAITSAKFSAAKTYKISASELSSSQNYTVRMVSNSMNVVATVYADTIEAASASDTLYAFIHGQLRGKAVSVLNSDIRSRRFTITIYNPTDTGVISFKFYSKVKEQTLDLNRRMTFVNNTISGTQYNPVKFSAPELKGKTLFTYNIPGQIGLTYYNGNEIRVIVPKGGDTLFVTPEFKISAGAIASIGDSVQYSAITRVKFPVAKTYKISASDLSTSQTYTIKVVTYSERVIASVFIDGNEAGNVKDTLYAYTNGFQLGKSNPVLNDSIKKYRFDIKIYSHTGSAPVSFKYYNSVSKQITSFPRTLSFNNNFEIGSVYQPFELCNPELKEAVLLSFILPGQIGLTYYQADTVKIIMAKDAKLTDIVPLINVSKGAFLKIAKNVVYSGITKTDLSKPLQFTVYSSDTLVTKKYFLKIVDYEMNFIATVVFYSKETQSLKDTLFAYTNNFFLGKAVPVYYDDIKRYRFTLKVNSHTLNSVIHFKYYETSTNTKTDLVSVFPFICKKDTGSVIVPVILANQELRGTAMFEYTLPEQIGRTIAEGNSIKVILSVGTDLQALVPAYKTLPGTHVMVNKETQYSGITSVNFTSDAIYTIYSSEYRDTAYYRVHVIINELDKIIAPALISPNGDGINDYWTIQNFEKLRESKVYVVNSLGTIIYESNGYEVMWDGTYKGSALPLGVYYYVIKSPGKIIASGTITLLK